MQRMLIAAALLLAACGQGQAPSSPPAAAAPGPSADAEANAEALQARVTSLAAPYNAADYESGRRVFAQCRSCHTIDEGAPNRVGPNLHGLFGREVGAVDGFAYSPAVQDAEFIWDAGQLDHWLANPQTFLPGNRMAFAGVRNETDRRDLIAYLMVETED